MSALGAYGTAVIAALTAQNTHAVTGICPVPPDFVAAQIDTLFTDVRIDAVKIGMLGQQSITRVVADRLAHWKPRSDEHKSELQSLMRISYDVFCLNKKTERNRTHNKPNHHTQPPQHHH